MWMKGGRTNLIPSGFASRKEDHAHIDVDFSAADGTDLQQALAAAAS
jgi:hypothetical protein